MTSAEPLYTFQADAIGRILNGEQIYLGFDPGLGKSRTALVAAEASGAMRVLVLCPASGRYVWEEQTNKWSSYPITIVRDLKDLRPGPGVFVVTYGLISQKDSPYAAIIAKGRAYDFTVLDEAAAVKNPGANRTKAILGKMLPKLGYVLPMSGTPAPNHAGELYPILHALYPEALIDGSGKTLAQWQFENLYCRVVEKRFGNGRPVRVIEGSKNIPALREKIASFMVRVKKETVLQDLPPVRYDVVPIGVDTSATDKLPTLPPFSNEKELLAYLNGVGDEHLMRLRRQLGVLKVGPAIEYIDDFIGNLPSQRKVLVFAHHKEVVANIVNSLADWYPVQITGASSPAARDAAIKTFLTDHRCRLFVGNIQASGTGITLVGPRCACSDVIFVEASYSPSDNVQAAARIHRIGQREAVVARFLTAHGTIDDAIQGVLARKAHDFRALFEGDGQ